MPEVCCYGYHYANQIFANTAPYYAKTLIYNLCSLLWLVSKVQFTYSTKIFTFTEKLDTKQIVDHPDSPYSLNDNSGGG